MKNLRHISTSTVNISLLSGGQLISDPAGSVLGSYLTIFIAIEKLCCQICGKLCVQPTEQIDQ